MINYDHDHIIAICQLPVPIRKLSVAFTASIGSRELASLKVQAVSLVTANCKPLFTACNCSWGFSSQLAIGNSGYPFADLLTTALQSDTTSKFSTQGGTIQISRAMSTKAQNVEQLCYLRLRACFI